MQLGKRSGLEQLEALGAAESQPPPPLNYLLSMGRRAASE